MGVPAPQYPIVEPFGSAAVNPADITLPIPLPSQTGVLVGAASFEDAFPPATRTDPEAGGVPPYGQDMNGILYMITQYCMLMQAGQIVPYDAIVAAAIGGYDVGAKVGSTLVSGLVWTNNLAGNADDPDADPSNWIADRPLFVTTAPAAGVYDDVVLPGPSDYVWDINTAAGNIDFSGFVAQRDGQRLYLSNVGSVNLLQVLALNGGSAANNQIRGATDLAAVQNQTFTIQFFAGLNKWLMI